jgi:hypothetical protein
MLEFISRFFCLMASSWAPPASSQSLRVPAPSTDASLLSLFSDETVTAACLEYLNLTLSYVSETTPKPLFAPSSSHSSGGGGMMMCLASVLESLSECDERTVFSVRKINKLGFRSHAALKKYFSQFGTVVAIFFLPYRYKPDTASIRPSSMAFIRMGSSEAVDMIFAAGEAHLIRDCAVTVQPFTRSAGHCH